MFTHDIQLCSWWGTMTPPLFHLTDAQTAAGPHGSRWWAYPHLLTWQ